MILVHIQTSWGGVGGGCFVLLLVSHFASAFSFRSPKNVFIPSSSTVVWI